MRYRHSPPKKRNKTISFSGYDTAPTPKAKYSSSSKAPFLFLSLTLLCMATPFSNSRLLGRSVKSSASDYEGLPDAQASEEDNPHNITKVSSRLVVDVLSIGSVNRLDYMVAQRESWASHPSIRNFVNATEFEDANPSCWHNMTDDVVRSHVRYCRDSHKQTTFLHQYWYLPIGFIRRKKNPPGWICAQARPGSGLGKMGRLYRQQQNVLKKDVLPEFLLVVDDDTMFQMDMFEQLLKDFDPTLPRVWAGCLTVLEKHSIYRYSPYGGAGTVWTRGALERLMQPIFCHNDTNGNPTSTFQQQVCERIQENLIYERDLFSSGMTLYEFMEVVFNRQPNCFFSDWLVGHFVNYYYLSDIWTEDPVHTNTSRLHPLHPKESFQYYFANLPNGSASPPGRLCELTEKTCDEDYLICHYVTPNTMRSVSSIWMTNNGNNTTVAIE